MNTVQSQRIFELKTPFEDPLRCMLFSLMKGSMERLLSFHVLNRMYDQVCRDDTLSFLRSVLDVLKVSYELSEEDLSRIPRRSSFIVVANHPFGAVEGIVLADILHSMRDDVRIMANYLLECIPELRHSFIPVDPFGTKQSVARNVKSMKEALRWVKEGHVLGVFPSGEVSHLHLRARKVIDPKWSDTIGRIVRRTGAPVLPVFFKGSNGTLFQVLGLLHPRLRTLMMPHELVNKANKKLQVWIGNLISYEKLGQFDSDTAITDYLRLRTYWLENRGGGDNGNSKTFFPLRSQKVGFKPLLPPHNPTLMAEEIDGFSAKQILVENGDYVVLRAMAQQAPEVLREIGRLRELTFRQVNEGTGKSLDLDPFDDYYVHLFVWNKTKREVVGAYRLGQTDEILARFGAKGLYSSTLFRYKAELLDLINPALELGRSFVRPDYQKTYSPLLLLWKGIARFVSHNPQYKFLFGTVSINNEYHAVSKHLMVSFLKTNNCIPNMAKHVSAVTPMRREYLRGDRFERNRSLIKDIDDLSALIADIEITQKGVPVLLKQYLKLGGKLLGFNIDPKFSNVLDGLILVDLTKADKRILERYMGKEGTQKFIEHHQLASSDRGLKCA